MPVQFGVGTIPLILLALCLVGAYAYFWWMHRRSITDMSAGRKRLALAIRLAIVTLLLLAVAGMRWVHRNDSLSVIFVVDASRSVRDDQKEAALRFVQDAAKNKRPSDTVGLLTFGLDPEIKSLPEKQPGLNDLRHGGATNATNIAQALDAALPLIPQGSAGKLVVVSDGNENVGSALAEVPTVAARGVKVDSVLLPSSLKKEALIEKVEMPPRVKIGEPFTVRVIVNALNAQRGTLSLRRDGQPVGAARAIDIPAGKRAHAFEVRVDKPGFYRFEAALETDPNEDTLIDNNKGLGFISVRGKPQILYVSPDPSMMQYLKRSLAAQNIDVLYAPPSAMPTTAAAFQQFDSLLLSDVPAFAFSNAQLTAMQVANRDFGIGFGMIGGENSFGLGGYRKTVVEEMLPVSLDIRKMQRFPPVCVALVIDRSGSMQEGGGGGIGGRKIDLAIEAAIRAVQALKPTDKVCVVTFTASAEIQVPLTSVEKSDEIVRALQTIAPGGGTSIYSGASLAFDTIKNDDTPIKHVILLTDGQSNDPDWTSLLQEMKKRKITMSTVGVGAGTGDINEPLLAYLAKETGGRFYAVNNAKDIPGIYLQEIERISSRPIVEEPFTPRAAPEAAVRMPGIDWNALPPLLGYNVTEAKPTADVLLRSHRNDPVLATWRYGLGRTLAFTSDDKNKWAAHWLQWAGFGQFWAEAVRWTMRSFSPSDFQTQVTTEGTRGHVVVDAIDKDGKFVNKLRFSARVTSPDADTTTPSADLPLRQTGPGHYEAWFDAAKIGTYLVNVTRERPDKTVESTITGIVVPYSPEYKDLAANDFLMTQLARAGGGAALTNASQVFGANRPVAYAPVELSSWLILFAMLLFPLDVGVRRLALEREDVGRAWAWIRSRFGRAPRTRTEAATPELARLRSAKGRVNAGGPHPRPLSQERERGESVQAPVSVSLFPARAAGESGKGVGGLGSNGDQPAAPVAAPEPESELSGMGRLMAAKRRAQEQAKAKDET